MDNEVEILLSGDRLTLAKAKKIESALKSAEPTEELHKRLLLAGFFEHKSVGDDSFLESFATHLVFLIDNHPAKQFHKFLFFSNDCSTYRKVKRHWMKAVRLMPDDPEVLDNAANFCSLWNPTTAEKIYLQAESNDRENPRWICSLSNLYIRHAKCKVKQRVYWEKKALESMSRLVQVTENQPERKKLLDKSLVRNLNDYLSETALVSGKTLQLRLRRLLEDLQ